MTDPFAQLEADLRRAAVRRARWGRIGTLPTPPARIVLAIAATTAAAVALVVGGIGSLRLAGENEVAAPVPGGDVSCEAERPPAVIAGTFSVLEGDPSPTEQVPDEVFESVAGQLPEGAMAKLWRDQGRVAREGRDRRYWILPALAGSCEDPRPAVCVVYVDEQVGSRQARCHDVDRLGPGAPTASGRLGPGRWFTAALVPDTTELVLIEGQGIGSYFPSIEGNVFEARYEAKTAASEVQLEFVTRRESEEAAERGGCPNLPITVTQAPPDSRALQALPMFERGDPKVPPAFWIEAMGDFPQRVLNLHAGNGRRFGPREGHYFAAAPVAHLPGTRGCAPVREPDPGSDRPGVCVVAHRGDGAAFEPSPACWTLDDVRAGWAFGRLYVSERLTVVAAVLPAGAGDAAVVPDGGEPVPLESAGQLRFAVVRGRLGPRFVLRYTNPEGEEVVSQRSDDP